MLLWSWSNFHSFLQICQNAILTSNSDLPFTWFDESDQGSTLITLSNTQTNEKMVAQKNDNLVWTLQSWRCAQRTTETAEVGAGTKSFCRPLFHPSKIFDEVFDITKMRYPTWVISNQDKLIIELVCFCARTLIQSESLSWQDFFAKNTHLEFMSRNLRTELILGVFFSNIGMLLGSSSLFEAGEM